MTPRFVCTVTSRARTDLLLRRVSTVRNAGRYVSTNAHTARRQLEDRTNIPAFNTTKFPYFAMAPSVVLRTRGCKPSWTRLTNYSIPSKIYHSKIGRNCGTY